MRLSDFEDSGVLKEERGVFGGLHVKFEEGSGPEGGISGDDNVVLGGELDEAFLGKVGVVFDLCKVVLVLYGGFKTIGRHGRL